MHTGRAAHSDWHREVHVGIYAIVIHKSEYKVANFLAAIKCASFKTVHLLLANL